MHISPNLSHFPSPHHVLMQHSEYAPFENSKQIGIVTLAFIIFEIRYLVWNSQTMNIY